MEKLSKLSQLADIFWKIMRHPLFPFLQASETLVHIYTARKQNHKVSKTSCHFLFIRLLLFLYYSYFFFNPPSSSEPGKCDSHLAEPHTTPLAVVLLLWVDSPFLKDPKCDIIIHSCPKNWPHRSAVETQTSHCFA